MVTRPWAEIRTPDPRREYVIMFVLWRERGANVSPAWTEALNRLRRG